MAETTRSPSPGFHEMPLVLFTTLGIFGGGIGVAALLEGAWAGAFPALTRTEGSFMVAILGVGAALSTGHLGRPSRAPLALRRSLKSPLGFEILALGITLAGGLGVTLIPPGPSASWLPGLSACAGAVAFLLAMGLVYRLPGRESWRGPAVLHPLVAGLAWGVLFSAVVGTAPAGSPTPGTLALLGSALLADAVLAGLRARAVGTSARSGEIVHPWAFRHRWTLLGARLGLSLLVPAAAVASGQWTAALGSLSLAFLLDRFAFYALTVRDTTESEIARVESLL